MNENMNLPKNFEHLIYHQEPGIVLYCADCREILPKLPKVDLVLTDPPYGIDWNTDYTRLPTLCRKRLASHMTK